MIEKIKGKAKAIYPDLVLIRQHLHAHPELSFQEYKTAQFIESELTKIGVNKIERCTETGIVALIEGKNPEQSCIALRADMDALPIQEKNETSYRSLQPNVMHACGHDVHTTCLLGAARILMDLREDFQGTVKLIFQPGEEQSPGGASLMIKEGVLENPKPAAIFGLHVDPSLPSGTVGFRPGPYMAASDEIHLVIQGKGGHAALPHTTIDPISISALIINALQQIVSRKSNPLLPTVLSFGKISGGSSNNIIPDEVTLSGTLRTFDENWRQEAKELIIKTVENICAIYGAKAIIHMPSGYPFLKNDKELTEQAIEQAGKFIGKDRIQALDLRMTAEDFSFYAQKIPACFFRLGTNKGNSEFINSVHSAHFDIDPESLKTGAAMMCWLAFTSLKHA